MTGDSAGSPQVVETHSAVVVLAGERVYKCKKAIDLGFLDFREAQQRADACRRELELNRRLAPDVYLDVATLVGDDSGELETVLIMRRLPDERRLASLVERGEDVTDCLRAVARVVAALHGRTRTADAVEPASLEAVRGNWEDNLATLRSGETVVPAADVERAAALAHTYLDGRATLFEARAELACDGHGDLLADDIFCLDDGPRIIDCLDFADRLRLGDPLLDTAFLAMDLEHHGREDLAEAFLGWYQRFSGQSAPATLTHHFIAYRAHVRAKVACVRAGQGDEHAPARAQALHRLCLRHLVAGQVTLVLVGGLPGTGKSTVASGLAEARGWTLLSSDAVRKDAAGVEHGQALAAEHYTEEARSAVYRTLLERAAGLLAHGESVVLDASWGEPTWRDAAAEAAERASAVCVALQCQTPRAVAHERLQARAGRGGDASDADPEVFDRLAERTPPWTEALELDATGPPDAVVDRAVALVASRLGDS